MPRREKEEKVQLGTYLPIDLYAQLQSFRDDSGIPITRIVEDAIREYLTRRHVLGHERDDEQRGNT